MKTQLNLKNLLRTLMLKVQLWRRHRPQALDLVVDELGLLQAQIAEITEHQRSLKKLLTQHGEGEYDGTLFRATVSTAERETLIAEKVREFLHPNQLRHCTRTTVSTTVRVVARKTTPQHKETRDEQVAEA